MSANFWLSSQREFWLFSQQELDAQAAEKRDLQVLTPLEIAKLKIHFADMISRLGQILKLRQRIIASAIVYFKRFYLKNSYIEYDPIVIAPTCAYVAAKVEECNTPAKVFDYGMRRLVPEFTYNSTHILECEYYVLEELNFQLIVYHPYRPLIQYLSDSNLHDCLETAWNIVNDSYRTDVCLLYPPYLIALAAIYLASFLKEKDLKQWFSDLSVEMAEIGKVTYILMELYELWPTVTYAELRPTLLKIRQKYQPGLQTTAMSAQG